MIFQVVSMSREEIMQKEIRNSITRRTFISQIHRMACYMALDLEPNEHDYMLLMPAQELVICEILHVLPVFLKYSPIIIAPDEDGGGFILFQSNRKIKVFSLQSGGFVGTEALEAQKSYNAMSSNKLICSIRDFDKGFSYKALEILEKTRSKWEGKLMLVPQAHRNTIRENHTDERLLATNEEMLAEGAYRLRLLGLDRQAESLFEGRYSISEQICLGWIGGDESEPLIEKDKMDYYNRGHKEGFRIAFENMNQEMPYHYFHTSIVHYKDKAWTLSRFEMNEKIEAAIKTIENDHDIFVYYLHREPGKDDYVMSTVNRRYNLLYVGRDMNGWKEAREKTAAGTPDVCSNYLKPRNRTVQEDITEPYFEILHSCDFTEFGSVELKIVNRLVFRVF